jgi:hypothetical protein
VKQKGEEEKKTFGPLHFPLSTLTSEELRRSSTSNVIITMMMTVFYFKQKSLR